MEIEVQDPSNQLPNIVIDRISHSQSDPANPSKGLMLRWHTNKVGGANVLSMFLSNEHANIEKRVCWQYMHDEKIEQYGITEGVLLNDKLPSPIRLRVHEVDEAEYLMMHSDNPKSVIPYSAKLNPSTGKYLLDSTGIYIYRGIVIAALDEPDVYLTSTNSTQEAPDRVKTKDAAFSI